MFRALDEVGLSIGQIKALCDLSERSRRLTVNELADRMALSLPAMS